MYYTVRTELFLLRYNLKPRTSAEAVEIAESALEGKIRNAGLKFVIELYRGAGLGAYDISRRLGERKSLEAIRNYCNHLDKYAK